MNFVEKSFPVEQYETYRDDEGKLKSRKVYDSSGNPVLNREAIRQREMLLDKLGSIPMPSSPLNMIIDHFGTDKVRHSYEKQPFISAAVFHTRFIHVRRKNAQFSDIGK